MNYLTDFVNFGWVIVALMWLTILFEYIFNFHHKILTIFLLSLLILQLTGYGIAMIKNHRRNKNDLQ